VSSNTAPAWCAAATGTATCGQQGADPQTHLQQQRRERRQAAAPRSKLVDRPAMSQSRRREGADQQQQQVGKHAVIELDSRDILEGRQPRRVE
jgi:hypothetical protein